MQKRLIVKVVLIISLPFGLFASFVFGINLFLGKKVCAGLNGPEIIVCALNKAASVPILVAGDSRAKVQLIPDSISSLTGLSTLNMAESLPQGGDLTTLVNSLRRYPDALSKHSILVISVSSYEINDFYKGTTLSTIFNWRVQDHLRFAAQNPDTYFPILIKRIIPGIYKEWLHTWKKEDFTCSEDNYVSPGIIKSKGFYLPDTTIALNFKEESDPKKLRVKMDGGNWNAFRHSLKWISETQVGRIIIYNAPINSKWRRMYPHSKIHEMEETFSTMMSSLMKNYPEITFLDYYRHPIPSLDSSYFSDRAHLNLAGAKIFSRIMAMTINNAKVAEPDSTLNGN